MIPPVDTKNAQAVARFVQKKRRELFGPGKSPWLARVLRDVTALFAGKQRDYAAIDLHYHDFEHTLQATVCLVLILEGRHGRRIRPVLKPRDFDLAVAAVLLHDSGYLRLRSDRGGTGARYTFIHELRSSAYAASYLPGIGADVREVDTVVAAIGCTGPRSDVRRIIFPDPLARLTGCVVATADYLAQMAAPDYVAKLPALHREFQESYDFFRTPRARRYSRSVAELLRRTPAFWRDFVLPKLRRDFGGVYRYLAAPGGSNPYLAAVAANLARIERG
ncbi:MAG: hypothetical protein KIT44_13955 [Opitutaceae bacterium]|nr:hypothetical protein [Opitutaceae bacterium]